MSFSSKNEPLVPSDKDVETASEANRVLAAYASTRQELNIELDDGQQEPIHAILPSSAIRILQRILNEMAQGNAITVIPMNAELTTQEAADFLNVSRPFIVKQIDAEKIPFRKVGTHRRIKVQDLLNYKNEIEQLRNKALDDLTAESQRLGLGY